MRAERVSVIGRSGFFDQEWVEVQLGRTFPTVEAAIRGYLAGRARCSPHPLFSAQWLEESLGASPPEGADPLTWYLRRATVHDVASPHPLVDLDVLGQRWGDTEGEFGPVVSWLRTLQPDSLLPAPGDVAVTWAQVKESSLRWTLHWQALERVRQAPRKSLAPPLALVDPDQVTPVSSRPHAEPLVSVVMPVWNRAEALRQAVASVQAQSENRWRLFIVDDGSEDDSLSVAQALARDDPRIVVLARQHRGVSSARNAALAQTQGPYLAFLDTDNTWRPDFLRVMVDALERHEDWDMAHAVLRATDGDRVFFRAYEGTRDDLLVANHVDLNVLMARRLRVLEVGGFDESLRRGVDHDLLLKLTLNSTLHLIPYIGVDYIDDRSGVSRITTTESGRWFAVIVSRHLVDWQRVASNPRVRDLTSLVAPDGGPLSRQLAWAYDIIANDLLEVVLVAVELPCWRHVLLHVVADAVPNLGVVAVTQRRGLATTLNVGIASTTGERVVVASHATALTGEGACALASALDDPGTSVAQAAVVGGDGLLVSAGASFPADRGHPLPFLHHHPISDLSALGGDQVHVQAIRSSVYAVRAEDLVAVGGIDPLCPITFAGTNLSLQLAKTGRRAVVVPHVMVQETPLDHPSEAVTEEAMRLWEDRALLTPDCPLP